MDDVTVRSDRPLIVLQLPEQMKLGHIQGFWSEVEPFLEADRPRMVFDFAEVRQLDSAGVDMLLHCLEQVMKRDGDLKLAAVPPHAAVILELLRADRLFEVFDTATDAVDSFHTFPVHALQQHQYPWYTDPESIHATAATRGLDLAG